jgi:hypothetical protein
MVQDGNPELGSDELSCTADDPEHLLPNFRTLEASVYKEANGIARSSKTLAARLERLAPLLVKVQEILSERGRLHHLYRGQDLPPWADWARKFVAKTGIFASWPTIKRAMKAFDYKGLETVHARSAVSTAKLQMQAVCYFALSGLELADALSGEQDYGDSLDKMLESGMTRDSIVQVLKRLGVKDVPKSSLRQSKSSREFGSAPDRGIRNATIIHDSCRPGAWGPATELIDQTFGPALRTVVSVGDPKLQEQLFFNIVSHMAKKWIPLNTNLYDMEIQIQFRTKAKPALRIA